MEHPKCKGNSGTYVGYTETCAPYICFWISYTEPCVSKNWKNGFFNKKRIFFTKNVSQNSRTYILSSECEKNSSKSQFFIKLKI